MWAADPKMRVGKKADAPAAVASLILSRLAEPRPNILHETAQRWSIDKGIDSHVAALERAFLRRQVG